MIIDVHTHVCPRLFRENRDAWFTPGENAFAALYRDPKARLGGGASLVAALDEAGADAAVAFGFPWSSEETARRHNDYLLEAQARFPGRVIGLACFDPLAPWAEREADRALAAGLQGLGELAVYDAGFPPDALSRFAALAAVCRDFSRPMMVHVNEPIGHAYPGKAPLTIVDIYALTGAVSGIPLILAHWGGGLFFYHLLKKQVAERLEHVYFDTAASPFLYRPDVYRLAVEIVGAEKILFGTDWPLLPASRYFREMDAAGLGASAGRAIRGDNAARLFGMGPR